MPGIDHYFLNYFNYRMYFKNSLFYFFNTFNVLETDIDRIVVQSKIPLINI